MKPTEKVSIGGYAFNLEEDAYKAMDRYISSLNNHFKNKEEGDEIVHDLELRIAELLQLKTNGTNNVITLEDVNDVIKIMGLPNDIDDDEIESENRSYEITPPPIKKSLFRDVDNSILGGVCSGFALFFNIDPSLIRIIYVLAFITSGFILPGQTRGFLVLAYIVLWIVMPKAKTFTQKVAMRGTPPPVQSIEKRNEIYTKPKGSGVLNFIKIFFGIILGIISLGIIIAIISGLSIYWGFYGGDDFPGINTFVEILGLNSFNFNVSLAIFFLFPLLTLFCLCIKLLLRSQFKTKDAVVFGLGFIIWIASGFYLTGIGWKIKTQHEKSADRIENISVSTNSDTLYVELSGKLKDAIHLNHVSPSMMYMKGRGKNHSISLYPKMHIKEDTSLTTFKIEVTKTAFDINKKLASEKAQNANFDYYLYDSLFIINPHIYNRKNKWDRELFEITITKPKDKTIICKDGL